MGLDQIYFVESITNQYNIIYRAKLGKEMNGKDFVKLCFEEKENSLKQYFDDSYKTDVGKRIKELIENGAEVDVFGVGDAIALPEKEISTVYKMSKIGEADVMKISDEEEKTSLPGSKVLYRIYENDDFTDVVMLEKEMLEGKKVKKLTVDYIKNGEKIEENYRLLGLEEAKKYYEDNLLYLQKIYSEKEKRNRVKLSENLKNLKENLIKRKKVDI